MRRSAIRPFSACILLNSQANYAQIPKCVSSSLATSDSGRNQLMFFGKKVCPDFERVFDRSKSAMALSSTRPEFCRQLNHTIPRLQIQITRQRSSVSPEAARREENAAFRKGEHIRLSRSEQRTPVNPSTAQFCPAAHSASRYMGPSVRAVIRVRNTSSNLRALATRRIFLLSGADRHDRLWLRGGSERYVIFFFLMTFSIVLSFVFFSFLEFFSIR